MDEKMGEAEARTRVAVTMALKVLMLTLLCMPDASSRWMDDRRLLTRARFGRDKQMASWVG